MMEDLGKTLPGPQGEISVEFERLNMNLATLEQLTEDLHRTFGPVVALEPTPGLPAREETLTPIGAALADANLRLGGLVGSLTALRDGSRL